MTRPRDDRGRWFLPYAIPGVVLAGLVSLQSLDTVEYSEFTLGAMTTVGVAVLLLVAAVHYAVVYRRW